MHFDHVAHRHLLCQLVPEGRQGGRIPDPGGQGRWDGDRDPAGPDRGSPCNNLGAVGTLDDLAHWRSQPNRISEPIGQSLGQDLGASADPTLLGSARCVDQPIDQSPGVDVEKEVEQRDVPGLSREDGRHQESPEVPGQGARDVVLDPGLHRLAVPARRLRRGPRVGERNRERHVLQRLLGERDFLPSFLGQPEALVVEPRRLPSDRSETVARIERREQLRTEFGREGQHSILGGAHPLPSELHDDAVGKRVVEDAPADAAPRLEHDGR